MPLIYHVYTLYIPCIYQSVCDILVIYQAYSLYILHCLYFVYTSDILCIYIVYILSIYHVYTLYIHGIYSGSGYDLTQPWSTVTLNRILQTCLVSDGKGNNIHTFQTVELKSNLYCWVMCTCFYPFNMEHHRFLGRNVKVCTYTCYTYTWYMLCI